MERAAAIEAFTPSRNTGFMFSNTAFEERMSWQLGGFTSNDFASTKSDLDSDARVTGRLTGLPFYEDGGRRLVHLGASASFTNPDQDRIRFRSRPESHQAGRFVQTPFMNADSAIGAGAELAWVEGPFSLQGEYLHQFVDSATEGDPDFGGFYAQASYFLTGEHRPFKHSSGTFDRVKPRHNFSISDRTWGAWEARARYSYIDLDDEAVLGGKMSVYTGGLNWYLNPTTRMMFEYGYADVEDGVEDGHLHFLQTRVQMNF
jgi:phosphate-selective porin OprO/OprP